MDLGIKGRRAIVCASSKGLGRACAIALANEGVHVTVAARGGEATKPPTRGATPDITHIAIGVANRYARMVTALRNNPVLKPVVTATANTAQTAMS